jgi:hypothetical protein
MSHPENTLKQILQTQNQSIKDLENIMIGFVNSYADLVFTLYKNKVLTKEQATALVDGIREGSK